MSADKHRSEPMKQLRQLREDLSAIAQRIHELGKCVPERSAWEICRDARQAVDQAMTDLGNLRANDFSASSATQR